MTALALFAVLAGAVTSGAAADSAPPAAQPHATITPERPLMVLGVDRELGLSVEVVGNAGKIPFVPERGLASVGSLGPITMVSPDHFSVPYLAPASRFPQVAIVVIDLVGGGHRLRAAARLRLHAAAEIPFRTTAGAMVTMRIGDQTFGPVRADAQGSVKIPIVVPPGIAQGEARAVDPAGGVRETRVDLQPRPFDRLLIVAMPQIEVGSFAEVSVFAVTPAGEPLRGGQVALKSTGGMVHPLGTTSLGEERFLVEAPPRLGASPLHLLASAGDADADANGGFAGPARARSGLPSRPAELNVPLVAGAPHRLILATSRETLIRGSGVGATLSVSARDRHDNPTSCAGVAVTIDHQPAPLYLQGEVASVPIPAPPLQTPNREVEIEARLGTLRAATRIRYSAGPAARLATTVSAPRVVADGHRSVDLRVDAYDRLGSLTAAQNLRWQAAGGRLGTVRVAGQGSYLFQFTPGRARAPRREVLVVEGDPPLTATTTLQVDVPRSRIAVTARVGLFSNFGSMAGPTAAVEALTGLPGHASAWAAGLVVGYLRDDLTAVAAANLRVASARLQIDQVPILAVARYRLPLPLRTDISIGGGAGLSLAQIKITSPAPAGGGAAITAGGTARAPAFELRSDVAFPLAPGELMVGLQLLWIDLGRTSQGDDIDGNSAGLVADIGFRMTW